MANYPARRTYNHRSVTVSPNRQLRRSVRAITDRREVALTRIEANTEEAVAVVQARNALGAVAAQADAALSGILNALPIYDETDADFRSQLKQATRASVIADVFRFNP